jgi:hypothetical protein
LIIQIFYLATGQLREYFGKKSDEMDPSDPLQDRSCGGCAVATGIRFGDAFGLLPRFQNYPLMGAAVFDVAMLRGNPRLVDEAILRNVTIEMMVGGGTCNRG